MDVALSSDGQQVTVALEAGVTNALLVSKLMENQMPPGTLPATGTCSSVAAGGEPRYLMELERPRTIILCGQYIAAAYAGTPCRPACSLGVSSMLWCFLDNCMLVRTPPAGYLLGGGMGILAARLGLGCDRVTELEMVLADGSTVVANKGKNNSNVLGHTRSFQNERAAGDSSLLACPSSPVRIRM